MPRIFITIILILGSGIIGLTYLWPSFQSFQKFRKEVQELYDISAELDDLIANRDKLVQVINSISKDELRRIDQALPQGPKSADFLVLMENRALRNGLVIKKIDIARVSTSRLPTPPSQPRPVGELPALRPKEAVSELPLTISVSGSYENFKRFLADLEKSLRLIDIEDISFTSSDKGPGDFTLKLNTYYQ